MANLRVFCINEPDNMINYLFIYLNLVCKLVPAIIVSCEKANPRGNPPGN